METGSFLLSLEVGTGLKGSVHFKMQLGISTSTRRVSGTGTIYQATTPMVDIQTELLGDFTCMNVMPKDMHILVLLEGRNGVNVRMVLASDWASGIAALSYPDQSGKRVNLENVPVRRYSIGQPNALGVM